MPRRQSSDGVARVPVRWNDPDGRVKCITSCCAAARLLRRRGALRSGHLDNCLSTSRSLERSCFRWRADSWLPGALMAPGQSAWSGSEPTGWGSPAPPLTAANALPPRPRPVPLAVFSAGVLAKIRQTCGSYDYRAWACESENALFRARRLVWEPDAALRHLPTPYRHAPLVSGPDRPQRIEDLWSRR